MSNSVKASHRLSGSAFGSAPRLARNGTRRVFLTLAGALACQLPAACARADSAKPAAAPKQKGARLSASHAESLATDATARLKAAIPPGDRLVILLTGGAGELAAHASTAIRRALRDELKVAFARVEQRPGGPLADPSTPGAHVDTVQFSIEPKPTVVVHVSEADGRLYIAARDPGRDPLGAPEAGWRWVLSSP